jgi:hypothetical protein
LFLVVYPIRIVGPSFLRGAFFWGMEKETKETKETEVTVETKVTMEYGRKCNGKKDKNENNTYNRRYGYDW